MSERNSIGSLIMREERFMQVTMRGIIDAYARARDLKPVHFYVLDLVAHDEGQSIKQLCAAMHIKPSNVSPLCRHLEEAGYLQRRQDKRDKRAFCLFLTPEGRRLLAGLDRQIDQTLSFDEASDANLYRDIERGFAAFRTLVDLARKREAAQADMSERGKVQAAQVQAQATQVRKREESPLSSPCSSPLLSPSSSSFSSSSPSPSACPARQKHEEKHEKER